MKLEDLFEKRERVIFQLISLLQAQPGNSFIKELSDQLGVSRATLVRYVEGFDQDASDAGLTLTLKLEGEQVFYHRQPDLSVQDYLAFFAQSSLKYQILRYLFDRDDFSIQKLSQHLLISEASLNRQLSSLNQLLEEFGLSIRNGRLKGSELQIRHLYYQLFWCLGEQEEAVQMVKERYISIIERLYELTFNAKQTDQLALWLFIGQRRMRLGGLDFTDLYQKMEPYQHQKFYDRLRQFALTLWGQQAGGQQEGEAMALFVFLFFQFILGAPQVEQMLAFGGPIQEATTLGLSHLRDWKAEHLLLNEEAMYHLNQLFGQLYFFRGHLTNEGLLFNQQLTSDFSKISRQILEQVSRQVYDQPLEVSSDFALAIGRELDKLFHYITSAVPTPILIGVSLSGNKVDTSPVLAGLRKELEQNRYIAIEDWQEGHRYDLIISDYRTFTDQALYLLYGPVTRGDLLALKNLIQTISRDKVHHPAYVRMSSKLGF